MPIRRTADPALTFTLAVALTPVVSYPTAAGIGRGAIELSAGAVRIVVVLTIAWSAVHIVASLYTWLIRPARSSPPSPPGAVRRLPAGAVSERRHADAA